MENLETIYKITDIANFTCTFCNEKAKNGKWVKSKRDGKEQKFCFDCFKEFLAEEPSEQPEELA